MLRTLNLAKRSSLLLLVAGALASGLSAQHPVIAPVTPNGADFGIQLSNPTSTTGQHAFLVGYFALESAGSNISKAIKKSLGAIAPYSSTAAGMPQFAIPNADTTTANAIPSGEFTVPPSVIAHAIHDVNWAQHTQFMHSFGAAMPWTTNGLTGASSTTALNWTGLSNTSQPTRLNTDKLARALVARQIGYVDNLPADDISVTTRANAVVDVLTSDTLEISFSMVLVEVQALPTTGQPPKIKLSKSKKVTLQLAGTGTGKKPYHWNGVYPVYADYFLEVQMVASLFQEGWHQMFVPTTTGIQAVNAEVVWDGSTPFLRAQMPSNVTGGQFAIFNWTEMQYAIMDNGGLGGPVPASINWLHLSQHGLAFLPFPMPNQGTN